MVVSSKKDTIRRINHILFQEKQPYTTLSNLYTRNPIESQLVFGFFVLRLFDQNGKG